MWLVGTSQTRWVNSRSQEHILTDNHTLITAVYRFCVLRIWILLTVNGDNGFPMLRQTEVLYVWGMRKLKFENIIIYWKWKISSTILMFQLIIVHIVIKYRQIFPNLSFDAILENFLSLIFARFLLMYLDHDTYSKQTLLLVLQDLRSFQHTLPQPHIHFDANWSFPN